MFPNTLLPHFAASRCIQQIAGAIVPLCSCWYDRWAVLPAGGKIPISTRQLIKFNIHLEINFVSPDAFDMVIVEANIRMCHQSKIYAYSGVSHKQKELHVKLQWKTWADTWEHMRNKPWERCLFSLSRFKKLMHDRIHRIYCKTQDCIYARRFDNNHCMFLKNGKCHLSVESLGAIF